MGCGWVDTADEGRIQLALVRHPSAAVKLKEPSDRHMCERIAVL